MATNKRVLVLFFCVLFGVIGVESYNMLKQKAGSFKLILPKIVVALFMCTICTPILEYMVAHFNLKSGVYPYIIIGLAAVSMPVMDWVLLDFLPSLLSGIKTILINTLLKSKDKNDKGDVK